MSSQSYSVPDPHENPEAYLSYSVQDAPDTSVKAWYNQQGKSYTKWRQLTAYNPPEYQDWKATMLQNYQNYLDAYNNNFNGEYATRLRLERSGFNGQYLANGIGGQSSGASSSGLAPLMGNPGQSLSRGQRGLAKVMQTLQLMSNAGIAMKNFGEGKAAMKYADDMGASSLYNSQQKGRGLFYDAGLKALRYDAEFALQNDPSEYGYEKVDGRWKFTGVNGVQGRNMRLETFLQNIDSTEGQMVLRNQQKLLNELTYENREKYEEATMKAQKELLEGRKELQDIEKEYADTLKRMGLAMPLLKAAMESLKLFL